MRLRKKPLSSGEHKLSSMKMLTTFGIAFLTGFTVMTGYKKFGVSMDAEGIATTDAFQQDMFNQLPPMPYEEVVVSNMMARDDTNMKLLQQNAPTIAPPELSVVNLVAAIERADNMPVVPTVKL